jgi:hypothetical protein
LATNFFLALSLVTNNWLTSLRSDNWITAFGLCTSYMRFRHTQCKTTVITLLYLYLFFYVWVLHPVASVTIILLGALSVATVFFRMVFLLILHTHYMFRPLRDIFRWNIYIRKIPGSYLFFSGSILVGSSISTLEADTCNSNLFLPYCWQHTCKPPFSLLLHAQSEG